MCQLSWLDWILLRREAGATYAYTFYTIVRQNNAFYGLFLYIEHDDNSYLEVCLLPAPAALTLSVVQYPFYNASCSTSAYWPLHAAALPV